MAMDMDEARGIIEDAKKRGMIHVPGEAPVRPGPKKAEITVLPDWLQESILTPPPRE